MESGFKEKVKISSCMWLGGADCSITTLNNILTGGGLTFFFVTYFGMSSAWSAACWLIFGLWNAVNDPIFGFISDHTKSKLGRRIPYIRYGAIIIAIVFVATWGTWFEPGNDVQMFIQMLVALFLFDTLYTAIATSIYVMPYEMAITNEARSKIFLVKIIFQLVALSVPLVLLAELENILNSSLSSYQHLMTGIGVAAGSVIFLSTFFYKEKDYIKEEEQYPFFKSLVECFKNKSFIIFEVLSFSVTFINTILMMGLSYYFEATGVSFIPCYAAMFIGIIFGMFLWMVPGQKWGLKKSIVIMCLLFGTGGLVLMLLGQYTVAGVIGFLAAGIGFAGGSYLIPLMNGDVIDFDESRTGLRREGMYAGVNSFICKPAISIANAVFPAIMVAFGYNADILISEQTDMAKFGIRIAWLAISVVLLYISAIVVGKLYPLSGKEWDEIKADLAKDHEEKQIAYEKELLERGM